LSVLLVQGDARTIPLADASVHCVVTSPPYYGLRDYQTGHWVGGDEDCEHRQRNEKPRSEGPQYLVDGNQRNAFGGPTDTAQRNGRAFYRDHCGRCGAVRIDQQIGLEPLHDCLAWARQEPPCAGCWICAMRAVFKEVHRVMRPEATLWLNVGDSYAHAATGTRGATHRPDYGTGVYYDRFRRMMGTEATADFLPSRRPPPGLPVKNLLGLPWRLALALQADGWILRSEIIWAKKNCMPESVQDRPTRAHEQIFLFSKQGRYYYDGEAVREPGITGYTVRPQHMYNRAWRASPTETRTPFWHDRGSSDDPSTGRAMRSVLSLASEPFSGGHFATFPTELVRKCLLAGAPAQVCSVCGKPWQRQVERESAPPEVFTQRHTPTDGYITGMRIGGKMVGAGQKLQDWRDAHPPITTGFSPSCACAAPTRRSIILDPFAGSGTVGLVARELAHDAVCLDLSMPYLRDIARERLGLAALARWTEGAPPRAETHTDLPLFAPLDTRAATLLC
jgi:DNA modification methylase